jgi:hypothetical protein
MWKDRRNHHIMISKQKPKYYDEVARHTGAHSYTAMKKMAGNNSRWKAANQSKDSGIRRIVISWRMVGTV